MGHITQLSAHEIQKIAAGQVVERPADVIKELIENSIDAGATEITLYVDDAGSTLLRVVDNGSGMDPDDAHACFQQHATSKIRSVDELQTIQTFGFRGEALSSIAAVSMVELRTKNKQNIAGTSIKKQGNQLIEQKELALSIGTDISIRNLFFNIPARKKFLKKKETEWRAITQTFATFCYQHHHIHFKLFSHDSPVYNCPPVTSLTERYRQLNQIKISSQSIIIAQKQYGSFAFEGLLTHHQYSRYDRRELLFFVNKRLIKSNELIKGVLKGYTNVLPPARFPAACIMITIDPGQVDINVHPRKQEVQFLHPYRISQALTQLVKDQLEATLTTTLSGINMLNATGSVSPAPITSQVPTPDISTHTPQPTDVSNDFFWEPHMHTALAEEQRSKQMVQWPSESPTPYQSNTPQLNPSTIPSGLPHVLGQYNRTYILVEQPDGLFMIDQHAAHERILYEQFVERFEKPETVPLLFPEIITLPADEYALLTPYLDVLTPHGIGIEPFGHNQYRVYATPVTVKHISFKELLTFIISIIEHQESVDPDQIRKRLHEKLHAQMACKAAIKAGDYLDIEQIHQLIKELSTVDNRLTCPHGRPTGWLLPITHIEKNFKRRT